MTPQTISPPDALSLISDSQRLLLDVRTPAEFDAEYVAGSVLCPLDSISPEAIGSRFDKAEPLLIMCGSGKRASQACQKLADTFPKATVVEGGISAWVASGLPVVRGREVMSLERQVRIAAGALVLLGAILGATVHIGFIGISGFVGAGLMFAGITDTCGMGMMLAKMPWNRRTGGASTAALVSAQ